MSLPITKARMQYSATSATDWLVGGPVGMISTRVWQRPAHVDDDPDHYAGANDQPDKHPTYEDHAYGGAGRDV